MFPDFPFCPANATESLLDFLDANIGPATSTDVAFFHAAFDSSGSIGKDRHIAFGGVFGGHRAWGAFGEAWMEVVKNHGLKYFKMSEAMTWHTEFAPKYHEWGEHREAKRADLFSQLINVATMYGMQAVGVSSNIDVLEGDTNSRKKAALFKSALLTVLQGIPATDYVTVTCDTELDIEAEIRRWMGELRRSSGVNLPALAGICFMDDRIFPGLQLADMTAWLCRACAEAGIIDFTQEGLAPTAALLKLLGKDKLSPRVTSALEVATLLDAIGKTHMNGG